MLAVASNQGKINKETVAKIRTSSNSWNPMQFEYYCCYYYYFLDYCQDDQCYYYYYWALIDEQLMEH